MNPVVHFEMPAEDRDRMAKFYSGVFGWQAQMFGEEMGNYVTVSTTDTGPDGRPTTPGAINGGFYPKSADAPVTSVVIGVEDIKAHAKKSPLPAASCWASRSRSPASAGMSLSWTPKATA
jgi:predicted enzyme related to lactoylglutathione lyase